MSMDYHWHLRQRMAEKGIFATSQLLPLLAEQGVHLSREQVYRLVTQPPQRLSMQTLAALCRSLDCTPNDLIEISESASPAQRPARETKTATAHAAEAAPEPRRARIRRPEDL